MLHHSRNLLPVFYHLVIIMRSILCCNAYVHHHLHHHRPITTTSAAKRAAMSSRRRCPPTSTLLWSSCSSGHSVQNTEQHQYHSNTQSIISHRSQGPTHLDQVEDAINATLSYFIYNEHKQKHNLSSDDDNNINVLLNMSPQHREMISISQHLQKRLKSLSNSKDCRRCWLQRKHCICNYCVSLEDDDDDDGGGEGIMGGGIPNVNRLFLLVS